MDFLPPEVIRYPLALQALSSRLRAEKKTVGLVPTMGCLHAGHLSLIHEAKKRCDSVIVSIFVNPLQFGPKDDLASYPRTFERDIALCQQAGVDFVFAPLKDDVYPAGFSTKILGGPLANLYCGASRPGFFDGILTVVAILFQVAQPHQAFFGEKDFQQLFLVKQMAKNLFMPVEVVGLPIVRESTHLAMSSRNTYLSETQKHTDALVLWHTICAVQGHIANGITNTSTLEKLARAEQSHVADFETDYIAFVHTETFEALDTILPGKTRLLLAGYLNGSPRVRLIDNVGL